MEVGVTAGVRVGVRVAAGVGVAVAAGVRVGAGVGLGGSTGVTGTGEDVTVAGGPPVGSTAAGVAVSRKSGRLIAGTVQRANPRTSSTRPNAASIVLMTGLHLCHSTHDRHARRNDEMLLLGHLEVNDWQRAMSQRREDSFTDRDQETAVTLDMEEARP